MHNRQTALGRKSGSVRATGTHRPFNRKQSAKKLKLFVIQDTRHIPPFNQPARDLNVLNKPLWFAQRDALAPYCETENTVSSINEILPTPEGALIYRDNLYFDKEYIAEFIRLARALGQPCRAAFRPEDKAFMSYSVPLARSILPVYKRDERGRPIKNDKGKDEIDFYAVDLWYYPHGYDPSAPVYPVFVESGWQEVGFYSVPDYMSDRGDLVHYVTQRTIISIENWVHIFFANVPLGIFSIGKRFENSILPGHPDYSNFLLLKVLMRSLIEQSHVLTNSELVKVGKNTRIDPTAVILGPTIIGSDCTIGPGVVIQNCYIGDRVNIDQGAQLMLSVIGDNSFLPFRAALYLTVLMEHCIVAQNTCLQMCVVGRSSFIGAGSTFTDYNLLPKNIEVDAIDGRREKVGQKVLGSCVGHNCRIGSGMVVLPGRMIESDSVLFAKHDRRIIRKNISFEESDHHGLRGEISALHKAKYPRHIERQDESSFLEEWE